MTEEERRELAGLRSKTTALTPEETERLKELEDKEEPLEEEDEFADAFDEAVEGKPKDDETQEEGEGDEQITDQSTEDDSDPEDDTIFNRVPDKDDEDNSGDTVSPETSIADLEAELAKEKQRTSSWEGRIKAANKRAEEAEAKLNEIADTDKSGETLPDADEDDSVLSEFIEEFPTLEKPIRLMAAKIAREIVEKEVGEIKPTISQVQETVESQAVEEHLGKITEAHSDWRKIYDSGALNTWITNQPKFMQPGLHRVVDEGSAEDIIELFDTYKKSTGQLKSTVNREGKSSKQKAKELEAVTHSSSGPPKDKKKAAANDFDGAWNEALST